MFRIHIDNFRIQSAIFEFSSESKLLLFNIYAPVDSQTQYFNETNGIEIKKIGTDR